MRKEYETPFIQKVVFDYMVQADSYGPSGCFGSVMNIATSDSECGDGTPFYFGWNRKNPGNI